MRYFPLGGRKQKNRIIIGIFILCLNLFPQLFFGQERNKDNKELSLDSVKKEKIETSYSIYLNGGYFYEMSHKKGGEFYFSTGLGISVSPKIDLNIGGFISIIKSSDLIIDSSKSSLMFPGLEINFLFYPFNSQIIKPFAGFLTAATLYPGPYMRSSLQIGSQIRFIKLLSFTIAYHINYITSSELNEFYSHLFSLKISLHF